MTQLHDALHRTAVVEALDVLGNGPEERFDRITRMTQEAFGVPLTFLNLLHDGLATAQSAQGWHQGASAPAEQVMCSTTVLSDEPLVVPDVRLDPRFANMPAVIEQGIRFYAGAPLSMHDGTRVGTLCILDAAPREMSAADVGLLQDLAHWAERELGYSLERDRVRRVVDGLVPAPVDVPGYDLDTLSVPRDDTGDLADWRVAADGRLHVTVGSVAASGGAAALLAAAVRSAVIARTDVPMDTAIVGLEAQVAADLSAADTVGSLFHLRLDPASGHVVWGDAGHGLAVVVRADGGAAVLRSADLPIGLQPATTPRTPGSLELAPGDVVVLCTDGVLAGVGGLDALVELARTTRGGRALVDHVRPSTTGGTLVVLTRR
ncbi:GAF domain-containing protein [Curtobacterium sp. UNCCL20]|uniref:PP2C family protein-serine/threonine phosphatase n=1 Tax=Curtobacterium sp. UNCCL20 TaxID=1502773 RepID=UPI00088E64B2|nr:SpoIIE family protein phosphatase [Curtobacterium sp. UNCCL20]SDQ11867.1 GAF domain-containing protein [Curtobacterium sp. UNCCL20]